MRTLRKLTLLFGLASTPIFAVASFDFLSPLVLRTTEVVGQCSQNGTNKVGKFDVDSFDYEKAVAYINELDSEIEKQSKNCGVNRVYSTNTDEAVTRLEELLTYQIPKPMEDYNWSTKECFEDADLENSFDNFMDMAKSFDNKAVISSSFLVQDDDWEHGERCAFWDFYFFRKDGFLVKWSFDYSL